MSKSITVLSVLVTGFLFQFANAVAAEDKVPQREAKNTDAPVVLEVRLLTLSEDMLERAEIGFTPVKTTEGSTGTTPEPTRVASDARASKTGVELAFLDEGRLRQLITDAQGDRRCNLLQAPRLTLCNGQTGCIDTTESRFFLTAVNVERAGERCVVQPKNEPVKLGFRMTARPMVSADGRFVKLALKLQYVELASSAVPLMPIELRFPADKSPEKARGKGEFTLYLQQPTFNTLAIDNTVSVPNGRTVLFAARKTIEVRQEFGPPVLSQVPYVNRLVKNVGYGRETVALVVMITPRILATAEPAGVTQATFTTPPSRTKSCPGARPMGQVNIVAELLKAYDEACATGRTEEAERLARAALILNPRCFQGR